MPIVPARMPQAATTPFQRFSFSGGLELTQPDHMLEPVYCRQADNVVMDVNGALTKRKGYKAFTASLATEARTVQRVHFEGGADTLVVLNGPTPSTLTESGYTAISGATTILPSDHVSTCIYRNFLFVASPGNTLQRWDGTTWFPYVAGTNMPTSYAKPKFIAVYNNHLVAANFGDATPDRSAVLFCKLNGYDDAVTAGSWDTTTNLYWAGAGRGATEGITGLVSFAGVLWMFTKNSIEYRVGSNPSTMVQRTLSNGLGCVAPDSIAIGANGLFFLSEFGPCKIDLQRNLVRHHDSDTAMIYKPIEPMFTHLYPSGISTQIRANDDALQGAQGVVWKSRYMLAFPEVGATTNSRVLVWHDVYGGYTTFTMPVRKWCKYDSRTLLFWDYSGACWRMFDGPSDNAENIPMEIETTANSLDGDEMGRKQVLNVRVDVENQGTTGEMEVLVDGTVEPSMTFTIPQSSPRFDNSVWGADYHDNSRALVENWATDGLYGIRFAARITSDDQKPFQLYGLEFHLNSDGKGQEDAV